MGGFGSGRWYRYGQARTTDEVKRLDVRELRKLGALPTSNFGAFPVVAINWCIGDRPTWEVRYSLEGSRVTLRYGYCQGNALGQEVEDVIEFDRTSCNYGGERCWFLCPRCGTRVAVLYLGGVRFRCRHCYGLRYGSQNESPSDRLLRKARKIRTRINASRSLFEPVWQKPKGMHWKTFQRLREKERIANQASLAAWLGKFSSLG
jgi:hypothetical protein